MSDFIHNFEAWSQRMIGATIRGQQVDRCELVIDTNGWDDAPIRVFIGVLFRENPTCGSKEERLLQSVFSETPGRATLRPMTPSDAEKVLSGMTEPADSDWFLDDELLCGDNKP